MLLVEFDLRLWRLELESVFAWMIEVPILPLGHWSKGSYQQNQHIDLTFTRYWVMNASLPWIIKDRCIISILLIFIVDRWSTNVSPSALGHICLQEFWESLSGENYQNSSNAFPQVEFQMLKYSPTFRKLEFREPKRLKPKSDFSGHWYSKFT